MSVSFKINPSIKTQFSSENLEVSKYVVIKIDTFSVFCLGVQAAACGAKWLGPVQSFKYLYAVQL
jgi:hypothetical protein